MLFDDYSHDYGVVPLSVGAPVNPLDASHGASVAAATAANDDWLLGSGLHPLDANVFTPPTSVSSPVDAGSGVAAIAAAATAADHDKMLVIGPYAPDPNYYAPPPPNPTIKKVSTISWYYVDTAPLATPAKPT